MIFLITLIENTFISRIANLYKDSYTFRYCHSRRQESEGKGLKDGNNVTI